MAGPEDEVKRVWWLAAALWPSCEPVLKSLGPSVPTVNFWEVKAALRMREQSKELGTFQEPAPPQVPPLATEWLARQQLHLPVNSA